MLPPAVAGIGLLAAFGRLGLLGGSIEALGIDIAFTQTAVVLAVTFVASPFYVRTAVSAFEAVDPTLPAAARTLGAGPARVFGRVSLPLAAGGLGAGAALAFARGIGEFGATIMFAGSLQGSTQTLSLAIYEQFDLDFDVALAISAVLVAISGGVLLSVKLLTRWRSGSTTPIPLRAFDAARSVTVGRGETLALVGPVRERARRRLRVVAGLLRPRPRHGRGRRRHMAGSTRRRRRPCRPRSGGSATCSRNTRSSRTSMSTANVTLRRARHGRWGAARPLPHRRARAAPASRELSGGERQRVALARALARRPRRCSSTSRSSALDAHTKAAVRAELRELLGDLGLPTVLVTHDFEDASALADGSASSSRGRSCREGGPAGDLIARPRDAFVASLHRRGLLEGTARSSRERAHGDRARRRRLGRWSTEPANGPRGRRDPSLGGIARAR